MTIYWWDTDKLIDQLAQGQVLERHAVWYAMLSTIFYILPTYISAWYGVERSWMLLYESIVVTMISLFGVTECFKANGGEQGEDFLKRFSVICIPVGLKVFLANIVLGHAIYYVFPYLVTLDAFRNLDKVYQLFAFAFSVIFTAIFYLRVKTHFLRLSQKLGVLG